MHLLVTGCPTAESNEVTAAIARSDMSMAPTALESCFFESLSICEITLADNAVCLTVTDQALISLCMVLMNVSTEAQVSAWAGSVVAPKARPTARTAATFFIVSPL
ncbi:hypothetical protein D3C80_1561590 [compost metagenome]